jgi:hypothetical protein
MRLIVLGLVILALTSTTYSTFTCGPASGGTTEECGAGEFCTVTGTAGTCSTCTDGSYRADTSVDMTASETEASVCTACTVNLGTLSTGLGCETSCGKS